MVLVEMFMAVPVALPATKDTDLQDLWKENVLRSLTQMRCTGKEIKLLVRVS